MAKPTQPKALKPKSKEDGPAPSPVEMDSSGDEEPMDMMKFIILIVVIVVASIGGSAASIYLLGPMVMAPALEASLSGVTESLKASAEHGGGEHGEGGEGEGEGHGGGAEGHGAAPGMNMELDEFTVNLKRDPQMRGTQYLRAKMALSVHVPDEENCHIEHEPAEGGGEGGGGHGGGAAAGDPCQEAFNKHMATYVPAVRDIINTSLMKRTANDLSSIEGQEQLKDEIKNDIDGVMGQHGHYSIIRVNFQDFIIQQ